MSENIFDIGAFHCASARLKAADSFPCDIPSHSREFTPAAIGKWLATMLYTERRGRFLYVRHIEAEAEPIPAPSLFEEGPWIVASMGYLGIFDAKHYNNSRLIREDGAYSAAAGHRARWFNACIAAAENDKLCGMVPFGVACKADETDELGRYRLCNKEREGKTAHLWIELKQIPF